MKIIHMISGGDVGGAKTHVHTLLAGLAKTEEVLLVCFMQGPFAEEAKSLGIPIQVMEGSLSKTVKKLEVQIREEGFQIIHCHGARANLIASLLHERLHLPTVTTVHSDYRLDYLGRPFAAMTYGVLNRIALQKMDYWIGVSDVTVDLLNQRGFDPNRVFPIYNGVAIPEAPAPLSREAYLRSLRISPDPDTVVFGIAARINPVKDMATLIQAFSQTVKVCPKARLIIAGDGEQRKQMEELANNLCPEGTVVFAGWVRDIQSFYAALDVNVLTSISETFPYALTEGASWKCATIATRVGGIPKLIDHEVNGFLIAPGDSASLAKYMIQLAKDPELIRTFADALYEKTKTVFSIQATVERQREIYRCILRRTARARTRERDGVMICGAYGKGNAGDDAILRAIVTELRANDPDLPIYVTSRSPKTTAKEVRAAGVYTFNPFRIRKLLKSTVLYLSGGGSLIQDTTSSRSLWYYLTSIRAAKRAGNRVMMFSCGVGPVQFAANRRRAGKILNSCVDYITLREEASIEELKRLGIKNIPTRVTADMAFLIQPASAEEVSRFCREQGLNLADRWMVIAPRPWDGIRQHESDIVEAAVYAAKTYGLMPVFLAMEPSKDRAICQEMAAAVRQHTPCYAVSTTADAGVTVGLIRRSACVLGVRLHSLVFAAAGGVPFAGIAYDPKVSGFISYLGSGPCCELKNADADTLKGMLDRLMRGQDDFQSAAVHLYELAKENGRIALSLISGEVVEKSEQERG